MVSSSPLRFPTETTSGRVLPIVPHTPGKMQYLSAGQSRFNRGGPLAGNLRASRLAGVPPSATPARAASRTRLTRPWPLRARNVRTGWKCWPTGSARKCSCCPCSTCRWSTRSTPSCMGAAPGPHHPRQRYVVKGVGAKPARQGQSVSDKAGGGFLTLPLILLLIPGGWPRHSYI